jgi:cytidylate kinase
MTIISISRGSYSRGKEVAEKVADKMGYDCVGREALLAANGEYDVPEVRLVGAMEEKGAPFERLAGGKERYISHIQAALTAAVRRDNVVYHGYSGQYLLKGVSHVLKVRIIAPLEYRIGVVMDRDSVSRQKAIRILKRDDEERYRWSRRLFLIDQRDCNLYDLVLNIDKCSVEDAADLICHAASFGGFETTPESQKAMDDLSLACMVKVRLVDLHPEAEVSADNGAVVIEAGTPGARDESETGELTRIAESVPGVRSVSIRARRQAVHD